ncbi:MAG: NAD(P)H-hydrate dehydratase [Verrucomicrobiia bacterium]
MIISLEGIRRAEQRAFNTGISAESLMADAAAGIAAFLMATEPEPGIAQIFPGKGHNGGDALAAALLLKRAGWTIVLSLTWPEAELAPLTRAHLDAVRTEPGRLNSPSPTAARIVIDGLLGAGTRGRARGLVGSAIDEINRLRRAEGCRVLAIDLPSGLSQDEHSEQVVEADWTLCPGAIKDLLVADHATRFVGRLVEIPLPALTPFLEEEALPCMEALTPRRLRAALPPRCFDLHKGAAGKVALVAGSPGMTGAAVLAALGALRGGAGLVTLFTVADSVQTVARKAPPEVMVRPFVVSKADWSAYDAVGFGPGLGTFARSWLGVIRDCPLPTVIDADGLNALAERGPLELHRQPQLLTPHPVEFARLAPDLAHLPRKEAAQAFVQRYPHATLLLKGARSIVADTQSLAFNTTGSPGLATPGIGDLLTGVATALLAAGLTPTTAARVASWTVGRAAELAIAHAESEESLHATAVAEMLGRAFKSLRSGWV